MGFTEATITENGSLQCFYKLTNLLSKDFKIAFTNKVDEFDSINWSFKFKRKKFNLFFNIYNGTSIVPEKRDKASASENEAVVALATQIREKFHNLG